MWRSYPKCNCTKVAKNRYLGKRRSPPPEKKNVYRSDNPQQEDYENKIVRKTQFLGDFGCGTFDE